MHIFFQYSLKPRREVVRNPASRTSAVAVAPSTAWEGSERA
jgi:hypothetical protein